jgi:hypothetical protein
MFFGFVFSSHPIVLLASPVQSSTKTLKNASPSARPVRFACMLQSLFRSDPVSLAPLPYFLEPTCFLFYEYGAARIINSTSRALDSRLPLTRHIRSAAHPLFPFAPHHRQLIWQHRFFLDLLIRSCIFMD